MARQLAQRHVALVVDMNVERVYQTTVSAAEVARALADHFRAQEFETQVLTIAR